MAMMIKSAAVAGDAKYQRESFVRDSIFFKQTALLIVLSLIVLVLCPLFGATGFPFSMHGSYASESSALILWQIRLPRVLLSYLVGAALSVSGVVFQAMLRNPLASPFTLGVSGGAAFGVALYAKFGLILGGITVFGRAGCGFIGAILSLAFVFAAASRRQSLSATSLLLAGVVMSFFFSSLVLLIQYISDPAQVFTISRWLMGSVETLGYVDSVIFLSCLAPALLTIFYYRRELDLLLVGDEFTVSRGVSVWRVRRALFVAVSLVVGASVAICGVIGFVGIVVPYICRILFGNTHAKLLPVSILLGGIFLTVCDTAARLLMAPIELPVGVITALIGGPFFLWVLCTRPVSSCAIARN